MATVTYKNLLGNTHTNPEETYEWDAGEVIPSGSGAPTGTSEVGDLYFDETADELYEATTTDWSAPIVTPVPTESYQPVSADDMWFDEGADTLYTAELQETTLSAPAEADGYVFGVWTTDPEGSKVVTEISDPDSDTTLYAQWDRIGDHVVLHVYDIDNYIERVNRNYIVEVMPVKTLVNNAQKYKLQVVIAPGTRKYLNDVFNNVADALQAREDFLALCA